MDLNNPKTYNEKMNWLKLHDRKTIYINMVDKYEVKEFVKQKLRTDENIIQIYVCFVDGKVYFFGGGGVPFFAWEGFIEFTPPEWDAKLGEMICLPM